MNAKQRYDRKRKSDPARLFKERARKQVSHIPRKGICEECGKKEKTVFHHEDYLLPKEYKELCYKCHRKKHPRKLPYGKVV